MSDDRTIEIKVNAKAYWLIQYWRNELPYGQVEVHFHNGTPTKIENERRVRMIVAKLPKEYEQGTQKEQA